MSVINAEFVERYQLEYQKNPRSRVFAALGEAYRKLGLIEEAHRICAQGVALHPEFVSGRVAFAKVLLEKKAYEEALTHLEKASKLASDNLLAHLLLGETFLELRRPKEALRAFKMVLFINPQHEKAAQMVKKWEFLTADEYDGKDLLPHPADSTLSAPATESIPREIERAISLADAFTVRNDLERALDVLQGARSRLGERPEIMHRLHLLAKRVQTIPHSEPEIKLESKSEKISSKNSQDVKLPPLPPLAPPSAGAISKNALSAESNDPKREKLEQMLRRISERRNLG